MSRSDDWKALLMFTSPFLMVLAYLVLSSAWFGLTLYFPGQETVGEVVQEQVDSRSRCAVQYEDESGRRRSFPAHSPCYVGERVSVIYLPDDPHTVRYNSFGGLFGQMVGALVFLTLIFLIGVVAIHGKEEAMYILGCSVFGLMGLGCLLVALHLQWTALDLRMNGEKTMATVLEMPWRASGEADEWDGTGDNSCTQPVLEFYDIRDRRVRFQSAVCYSSPEFAIGDQLPVLYKAEKPWKAQADDENLWLSQIFLGIFGVVQLAAAGFIWRISGFRFPFGRGVARQRS